MSEYIIVYYNNDTKINKRRYKYESITKKV